MWQVLVVIVLALFANVASLAAMHWRGMLKATEDRGRIELRIAGVENAVSGIVASVASLRASMYDNGFAKKEDFVRMEHTMDEVRESIAAASEKIQDLQVKTASGRRNERQG